jgi:hypothetical protein
VPERHLEAWRLSRENLGRSSPSALRGLHEEAGIQQILRLVQNVPLARIQLSEYEKREHNEIVRDLLLAYREQLIEAIELLVKRNRPEPAIVRAAIKHIEWVLGIKHWVGPASSSAGAGKPPPRPRVTPPALKAGPATGVPPEETQAKG